MKVFLQRKQRKSVTAGFSLVEILVTGGIMVMVTSAVMVKYSAFDSATLLKSQALEIALDVRTAQQYGVNVRAAEDAERTAYGIYFDAEDIPGEYLLFSDSNDNNIYESGEQVGTPYLLDDRFYIKEICIGGTCDSSGNASIAFKRPNFDALIYSDGSNRSTIRIVVGSRRDDSIERGVVVYSSGQVTVE